MATKTKKPPLAIPTFHSEAEEAQWWEKVKFAEQASPLLTERSRQRKIPPAQRQGDPSAPPVSIRFDPQQIADIKELANEQKVNYQTLIKLWIAERLNLEKKRHQVNPKLTEMVETIKAQLDQSIEEQLYQFMAQAKPE